MRSQIRKADVHDVSSLVEVLADVGWFEAFKHDPVDVIASRVQRHIEQCLADNSHTIFVVESDGKILGYGSVHWLPYLFLPGPEGYISELFVRESARGAGLGQKLLDEIQAEAHARGCTRLSLINLRNRESYARRFYEKAGWEERSEAANFIYRLT